MAGDGRLERQVALVTGGASGLGRGVVEQFVAEGARVTVLDRSGERLEALKRDLGEAVCVVTGDVRSLADNQHAVAACIDQFGGLDVAVGNAGLWDYMTSLAALPEEGLDAAFDEIFQVNVKGYLLLAKAVLKPLAERRGSIILTLSNAAFLPAGGGPLYTASKHAVVGLVRQLAYELSPHVRVNGIAPGGIRTELKGPAALGQEHAQFPGEKIANMAVESLPVGRLPTVDEYAAAYTFLAARKESFPATGMVLNLDGGMGVMGFGPPRPSRTLLSDLGLGEGPASQ